MSHGHVKPILFILLLIAMAGCEKNYAVVFEEIGEKKFFTCKENQGMIWIPLRVCETAAECNDFCEEKRKATP